MKKKYKVFAVYMLLVLMLAGCGKTTNSEETENDNTNFITQIFSKIAPKTNKPMSMVLNVNTGDSVKITLDTSEDHKLSFNKDNSIIEISDSEDKIVMQGIFVPQNSYSLYYETAYTDSRCEIKESEKANGVAYTYYTYNDGDKINCEYIAWVIGTNTGVVFESTKLSPTEGKELIDKVSFEVEHTTQFNEEYVYEPSISTPMPKPQENTYIESADNSNYENNSEGQESNGNPKTDWSSLLIKIDGVEYSFPYSFKTLQANGWGFNINDYLEDGETEFILEEGEYTYSDTSLQNEKYDIGLGNATIYVGFKNYTENPKNITDCGIWAMEVSAVYGMTAIDNRPEIELPGGIKFGATYDQIIATYGEPNSIEDNDYYVKMNYEKDYNKQMDLYIYTGTNGSASGLLDVEFRGYN